jgi:hypothetical protein
MVNGKGDGAALDRDFSGLVDPAEIVEAGRPDIVGDERPGSKMIAAVRSYDFATGQQVATQVQPKSEPRASVEPVRTRNLAPTDAEEAPDLDQEPEETCEPSPIQEEPEPDADPDAQVVLEERRQAARRDLDKDEDEASD